jgi:citrate lyase subunit beta / citryl-CoA lyase
MSVRERGRRSTLTVPATSRDLKELLNNKTKQEDIPDVICLDLEDMVHPRKKAKARDALKDLIPGIAASNTEVLLRINNDMALILDDLKAGIWHGLKGVVLPKVESPAQVRYVDEILSKLETLRGINAGTIKIEVLIETMKGNWYAHEIATASPRVDALCIGVADLTTDEVAIEAARHMYLWERAIVIARVAGVLPYGTVGLHLSQAYKDKDTWRRASRLGHQMGFKGALTVHRGAVNFLNQAFPS